MSGLWPNGPLLTTPMEQAVHEIMLHRIVATRGDTSRTVCWVRDDRLDAAMAAFRSAMHGWEIREEPALCRRLISGGDLCE